MRILLAEDEKDMADVLIAIMKHQGFDVDWAENGAVAVDLAARTNYDCMVFDIMMPVKDGITALKEVRAAGDVTPVIMLTAKSEVDDRITGLDSGADDYLTKPFAIGELLARIRSSPEGAKISPPPLSPPVPPALTPRSRSCPPIIPSAFPARKQNS